MNAQLLKTLGLETVDFTKWKNRASSVDTEISPDKLSIEVYDNGDDKSEDLNLNNKNTIHLSGLISRIEE